MDEERTEDLNPRSDDIEEKVRQMLDPSIPDVPDLESVAEVKPEEKPEKVIVIKSTSTPAKDIKVSETPSAPELPVKDNKKSDKVDPPTESTPLPPSAKGSKKVIIPISHHDAPAEAAGSVPEEPAVPQLVKQKDSIKPVNKITIADHDESTEGIAEKLDEAIAELEPGVAEDASDTETSTAAAPEVEQAQKLDEISAETETAEELGESTQIADEIAIADPEVITDPVTDKAVADIVAAEGDEILEIEDAVRDSDEPVAKPKKPRRNLFKALGSLLRKPAVRWVVLLLFIGGGSAAAVVPTSRYFVLNTAGVRVNSSLTVLDDSTSQPLKNVEVRLGNSVGTTNEKGEVTLNKVRLGNSSLAITKRAFAPLTKTVVIGWGSNPLGDVRLTPTGTQYTISVSDFLSGKVLGKVAASSGQADALSDDKGVIKLTIDKPAEAELVISFKLEGYRDETLTINPDNTSDHSVKLVPAKKHVYISKRTGKYDIYSSYIDGKDEKVVLAGSGNERDDLVLVPHPRDNVVAYISTRAGQRNSEGFVLSNLLLINLQDNETTNIGASEQIKIVSWSGDRLVYVQIAAGASADTPNRFRLISYNYKDSSSKELAKSNFFNDVIGIGNTIYYAPSSAYQTGSTNFYRVNVDGTNNETLHDKEVWNMFRTSYDHLALSIQQQWYDYRVGDKQPTKLNVAPADQVSRVYIDSPDGKHSVWVDSRDGKGVLLSYDTVTKTDKTLKSENGIGYPVRWLNDSVVVYRIKNNQQTADYAISLDGGEAIKINDVTNTLGLGRWFY